MQEESELELVLSVKREGLVWGSVVLGLRDLWIS